MSAVVLQADSNEILTGVGVVGTLLAAWAALRSWYKSELREAREELDKLRRDKIALQGEVTRLLPLAYPITHYAPPRQHERPGL